MVTGFHFICYGSEFPGSSSFDDANLWFKSRSERRSDFKGWDNAFATEGIPTQKSKGVPDTSLGARPVGEDGVCEMIRQTGGVVGRYSIIVSRARQRG